MSSNVFCKPWKYMVTHSKRSRVSLMVNTPKSVKSSQHYAYILKNNKILSKNYENLKIMAKCYAISRKPEVWDKPLTNS